MLPRGRYRRMRGRPKCGKTLLSPNQVIAEIRSPSSVRTSIGELGYEESDVDAIVAGALQQQRLLSIAPREPSEADLHHIVTASL